MKREEKIMKWIPLVALIVALCALSFQTMVLYPWHIELSHDFAKLAKNIRVSK